MKQDKLARVRNAALAPYGVWALVFIVVPLLQKRVLRIDGTPGDQGERCDQDQFFHIGNN